MLFTTCWDISMSVYRNFLLGGGGGIAGYMHIKQLSCQSISLLFIQNNKKIDQNRDVHFNTKYSLNISYLY